MILYIKDEFTALVGKLFSAYYGTFSMAFATLHGFCRDQNSSINSYPWSVLSLFVYFFTFFIFIIRVERLVEVLEGFQKTGYGVMVFCFYVHYSTYASRPMLDGKRSIHILGWGLKGMG